MEKNACVSVYPTHQGAEQALIKLKNAGIDLQQVSMLGLGSLDTKIPIGLYTINDSLHFLGDQSRFWKALWGQTNGAALLWVPDFGSLVAAGPIIDLLVKGLQGSELAHGLNVLGAAMFTIGVPRRSIAEYEQSISTGKLLLIVHDEWEQVEHACKVLHAENQQVTVHHA